MILAELHEELRRMLGNPTQNEQNNREINSALERALAYLAGVLKFDERTDEQINLTADQREYLLPQSFVWLYWVEWNGNLLTPTSTFQYNNQGGPRGGGGVSWHTAESGTPLEYALEGRKLILLPPADSDSVTTRSYLSWRWMGSGDTALTAAGTPKISKVDQELLLYEAAIRWLSARPGEENRERLASYERQSQRLLPVVRSHWQAPDETFHPVFQPMTALDRSSGYR